MGAEKRGQKHGIWGKVRLQTSKSAVTNPGTSLSEQNLPSDPAPTNETSSTSFLAQHCQICDYCTILTSYQPTILSNDRMLRPRFAFATIMAVCCQFASEGPPRPFSILCRSFQLWKPSFLRSQEEGYLHP